MKTVILTSVFAAAIMAATIAGSDSIGISGTAIERLQVSEWELVIFQADDQVDIFVNSRRIEQCTWDCVYDLTPSLRVGENSVRIVLKNRTSIWTYGYVLFHLGEPYAVRICGIARTKGCKNDDASTGEVFSETIPILMEP